MGAVTHASIEHEMDNSELSAADIAAFLDGRLDGEERKRVEACLADNPAARQELIKSARILASLPAARAPKAFRSWILPLGGLAAAAAFLLLIDPGDQTRTDRLSTERQPASGNADRIELVSPGPDAGVVSTAINFAWRRYDGASYRVVISDETGHVLHQQSTSDTTLTVSLEKIAAAPGKLYWAVDALSENGSTISSGLSEFELHSR
jgi:hypothetical protein